MLQLIIEINDKKILVDPMLGSVGSIKSVPLTNNKVKNPLVSLPISIEECNHVDAIFITHTHFDHFDDTAKRLLSKQIPVFCQPQDVKIIRKAGFLSVAPIEDFSYWEGIKISRIPGKHGVGLAGLLMGNVSGFIFEDSKGMKVYVAGDTIYNNMIREAIHTHNPDMIVVNAGAAKMIFGKPITMTKEEVVKVAKDAKGLKVIAVHLEAVNHCTLHRDMLKQYLSEKDMDKQVIVPNDGEIMTYP